MAIRISISVFEISAWHGPRSSIGTDHSSGSALGEKSGAFYPVGKLDKPAIEAGNFSSTNGWQIVPQAFRARRLRALLSALRRLRRVRGPRLRLLADDVHEVAHREVDIHEMQSPVRQHLTSAFDIANNVVGARVRRVPVHSCLKIGCVVIFGRTTKPSC